MKHIKRNCTLGEQFLLRGIFLESKDYEDCLKLEISLGGDADTLGAISGPMAYAFYREMPEELVANAKAKFNWSKGHWGVLLTKEIAEKLIDILSEM